MRRIPLIIAAIVIALAACSKAVLHSNADLKLIRVTAGDNLLIQNVSGHDLSYWEVGCTLSASDGLVLDAPWGNGLSLPSGRVAKEWLNSHAAPWFGHVLECWPAEAHE